MQTLTSTQVDLAIYLLSYLILVAYLIWLAILMLCYVELKYRQGHQTVYHKYHAVKYLQRKIMTVK
jgi:hypothetical protein